MKRSEIHADPWSKEDSSVKVSGKYNVYELEQSAMDEAQAWDDEMRHDAGM